MAVPSQLTALTPAESTAIPPLVRNKTFRKIKKHYILKVVRFGVGIRWMKAVLYMKLKMSKTLLLKASTRVGHGAEVR